MKAQITVAVACMTLLGCQRARQPDKRALEAFDAYMRGDFSNALSQFTVGAAKEDPFSLYMLGLCYERGSGVSKDETNAIGLYRQSAELGYPYAWRALGVCYRDGVGTEPSMEKAHSCFTKAMDGGVVTALRDLGGMYLEGRGVPKDEKKAVELYTEAAHKGDPGSKHNLGEMYYFGRHFTKDQATGCRWFADAAGDGFMNSVVWVVALYDTGSTNVPAVPPNHPWRRQIVESGMQDVAQQLTAALKSGNPEDIEKARLHLSSRSYWFGILK